MEENEVSEVAGQGPANSNGVKETPSIATIEKWIVRDVASAVSLLNAILADKDLRMYVATFMQGRFSNHLNKPDPNQADLFPKR